MHFVDVKHKHRELGPLLSLEDTKRVQGWIGCALTRELCDGPQPRHRGDEHRDLEEQEQLQVALAGHLLAGTAIHLHADREAGHNGAAGQVHDDDHQQHQDRDHEPEHEGVVVQEPAGEAQRTT